MRAPALSRSSLGTVILTFICVLTKESVEITPVPYTLQVRRVALDGRDPSNPLRKEKKQVPTRQEIVIGLTRHLSVFRVLMAHSQQLITSCLNASSVHVVVQVQRTGTQFAGVSLSSSCHVVTFASLATGGTLVLGILVAIFGVISILYIVNKVGKLLQENRIVSSFYSCDNQGASTRGEQDEGYKTLPSNFNYVSLGSRVEVKRNEVSFLLPESKKEIELPVNATPSAPLPQSSHELPDCVRPARKTQLPDNPAILYTVVDHVPPSRWKEFVRRLGLSDYDLERIELDHRRLRDAQYEMLRLWKLQMGRAATVEHISSVLNQMELSGCSDAIQEALLNQNSPQPCSLHNHL
ncbi:tumor necrosis factor receptor superfamily member 1A isoform X2 [Pitangus sulphuratus]|nr:tumor necrosis factor receptor superfamily member 1A isoform X2 [Pitangus sulphuratus]